MIPPTTNSIQGGASFATGTAAAGTYADAHGVSYSVGMSYNKGGTNPQGQVLLTLPRNDGYTYYVKSNSISSLAFSNSSPTTDGGLPKDVTIYTKASIYKVNNVTGAAASVDGGVTLRVDAHEGCLLNSTNKSACMTASGDKIGFTVLSSKTSSLYYSNNWVYDDPSKSYRTVPQPVTGPGSNIGCAVSIN